MGTYIDENEINMNSESEVKKLQALVKRLEQQNQVLRSKQNDEEEKPNDTVVKSKVRATESGAVSGSFTRSKDVRQSVGNSSDSKLGGTDVLDLSDHREEDDESWLYASPKKTSPTNEQCSSPHDWMRQDLEDPSPDVAATKRSLVFKLNDAARIARSPSSGGLSSSLLSPSPASSPMSQTYRPPQATTASSSTSSSPLSQTYRPLTDSPPSHISPQTLTYIQSRKQRMQSQEQPVEQTDDSPKPAIKKPLRGLDDVLDNSSSRVNTNTFRKKKNPLLNHTVVIGGAGGEDDNNEEDEANSTQQVFRNYPHEGGATASDSGEFGATGGSGAGSPGRTLSRNSSAENPSDSPRGSDYKLTDVVDVQVLARMQEESLRQSMNSPKLAKRTMTRPKKNDSSNGYGSTRSSPGRYLENDGYRSMHKSNQSLGSLSSNSDSPANSPYSSQYLDNTHQAADGHRRSLPNLAKSMPLTLPSHPSHPQLADGPGPQSARSSAPQQQGQQEIQRRGSPSPRMGNPRYQTSPSSIQRRGTSPQLAGRGNSGSKSPAPASRLQQQGQLARTISPKRAINPSSSSNNSSGNNSSSAGTATSNSLQSPERSYSPQRTLSPNRGRVPTDRNASPHRSSLPTPTRAASGIPRPGSASKLPAPKKSAIPASRRAALFNKADDSWKDGCY